MVAENALAGAILTPSNVDGKEVAGVSRTTVAVKRTSRWFKGRIQRRLFGVLPISRTAKQFVA